MAGPSWFKEMFPRHRMNVFSDQRHTTRSYYVSSPSVVVSHYSRRNCSICSQRTLPAIVWDPPTMIPAFKDCHTYLRLDSHITHAPPCNMKRLDRWTRSLCAIDPSCTLPSSFLAYLEHVSSQIVFGPMSQITMVRQAFWRKKAGQGQARDICVTIGKKGREGHRVKHYDRTR